MNSDEIDNRKWWNDLEEKNIKYNNNLKEMLRVLNYLIDNDILNADILEVKDDLDKDDLDKLINEVEMLK